jgi:iron complex outermembrane recepter protein
MWRAHARVAMLAAAAMALMPELAGAQQSPAVSPEALQEVIVTGSRIARPMDEATGPVTVIDTVDLARLPADSIGEILQRLPLQNGATMNTNVNVAGDGSIRGDGSTRINLRGLGPERTLVLLNGRRFVFGGLGGMRRSISILSRLP